MTALLGIDLGGTWTRIARIDSTGGSIIRFPTPSGFKASQELTYQVRNLLQTAGEVNYVSIARAPGLDFDGYVCDWSSRPDWVGVPLLQVIEAATNCSPFHADDGMCAAWWEHLAGWWSKHSTTACLSIGTGLGMGIVRAGQLLDTGDGSLSLGHLPLGNPNHICTCGKYGCLQSTLSGRGLGRVDLSERTMVVSQIKPCIAETLHYLHKNFDVDRVVFTGGVVEALGKKTILAAVEPMSIYGKPTVIVSKEPSYSGLIGALALLVTKSDWDNDIKSLWFGFINQWVVALHGNREEIVKYGC